MPSLTSKFQRLHVCMNIVAGSLCGVTSTSLQVGLVYVFLNAFSLYKLCPVSLTYVFVDIL